MYIKFINTQIAKIILFNDELEKNNLSIAQIKENSENSKQQLINLFKILKKYEDFNIIEVFPYKNVGFLIYVNLKLDEKTKTLTKQQSFQKDSILIANFETLTDASNCCKMLLSNPKTFNLKSEFLENSNNLILIVHCSSSQEQVVSAMISEFGLISGKGELKRRIILEHGTLKMNEKAIELLSNIS